MDIKVDIAALGQVRDSMNRSIREIGQLESFLNPDTHDTGFWEGAGKQAYLEMIRRFRTIIKDYSSVLSGTSSALSESLAEYVEDEGERQTQTKSLSADGIF